jgi:hypothetical protein
MRCGRLIPMDQREFEDMSVPAVLRRATSDGQVSVTLPTDPAYAEAKISTANGSLLKEV